MRRGNGWWLFAAAIPGLTMAACAGGTTDPPPPPPPPAVTLDMALGDVVILDAPAEVRAFRLASGGQARDYEITVQSASKSPGSTEMRLSVLADGVSANAVPLVSGRLAPGLTTSDLEFRLRASSFEKERILRQRVREELIRVGARPVRPTYDVSASIAAGSPPQLGQMLTFTLGVDSNLNVDCNSNTTITGEVKYVGSFTIVEDVRFGAQPVGDRFTDADFLDIGQQLDGVVYPTDVAYFGAPADIDNNQTVIALITAEVNEISEVGASSIVAGFFFSRDLATKASCPASNEGEIFYLVGPDPDSDFGARIDLDFANTLARTTVAHEFLHLLNTQQRVMGGGDLVSDREDAWLDEGLAHLAEEIAGLAAVGVETRANLDLDQITTTEPDNDAYNDFHRLNHDRLGRFLQGGCVPQDPVGPAATQALGKSGGLDPGGVESLKSRGFGYGFVRWLGDHFGPEGMGVLPGSREEILFQQLSSGGPTQLKGIANVERAIQVVSGSDLQWNDLVALYMASLVVDDNAPPNVDPRTQSLTWNLRDVYGQLKMSNLGDQCPFNRDYPLLPATVTLNAATNRTLNFRVNASTGRFVSLNSVDAPADVTLELTDASGGSLGPEASAQITIIRTR